MRRFVRRVWRVVVPVTAALAFLLAWFVDYDGLGQALGLGAVAGRVVLAGLVAVVVGLAVARFTRPVPTKPVVGKKAGRKPRPRKSANARKPVTTRSATTKTRRSTRRG